MPSHDAADSAVDGAFDGARAEALADARHLQPLHLPTRLSVTTRHKYCPPSGLRVLLPGHTETQVRNANVEKRFEMGRQIT